MTLGCAPDDSWERRLGIPEWEHRTMTICIAAICEAGHTIILAADRELGNTFTSAEFDGKWLHLYDQWSIGISGTVHHATDVVSAGRRLKNELESTANFDVQNSIMKAYRQARMAKAEARFLGNRGWSMSEFKTIGSTKITPETYATIDAQIAMYNFDTDLLIAGFGKGDAGPSIMSVTNPGVCNEHSKIGFWCVGSGATASQMSLFSREYSWHFSAEKAAYYVYEAKKAAERAAGVGLSTDLLLIRRGPKTPIIIPIHQSTMEAMETIREELAPGEFRSGDHEKLKAVTEFEMLRRSP
jgi:hypothetical protein